MDHLCATTSGSWGPAPCLQIFFFFKIMQFSGNFKEKTPVLSKFWALAPLTKILDTPLATLVEINSHVAFAVLLFQKEAPVELEPGLSDIAKNAILQTMPTEITGEVCRIEDSPFRILKVR